MKMKNAAKTTATGVSALANVYYDWAMLANLKANTDFMRWGWDCACGNPQTHTVGTEMYLCDGCFFRWKVMDAAGRGAEFRDDYEVKHNMRLDDPNNGAIDILKHRPLPVRSGKTIQMFKYEPLKKS